jgi:hypothetical protein
VVEKLKEGYESDVVDDDSDSPSDEKDNGEARRSKGKLEFDSHCYYIILYFPPEDGHETETCSGY